MKDYQPVIPADLSLLFDELEEECLNAIKYIEVLKLKGLSDDQQEDFLGELSASITHLRIQTEALDKRFDEW